MPRAYRVATETFDTDALVVRRVAVREADLLATLFTRSRGLVTATAAGARKARSKLGVLEPLHTTWVRLEIGSRSDIARIKEAKLVRPRMGIVADVGRLEAASRLLAWLRGAAPPLVAEPLAFEAATRALDELDRADGPLPEAVIAVAGARILSALGYGLELEACVRCGSSCPPSASAFVDSAAGGVVCRACGGSGAALSAEPRMALARASRGEAAALPDGGAPSALAVVERAFESRYAPSTKRPRST